MKLRTRLISNSSSSSFSIYLRNLTPEQIELIENHSEESDDPFAKSDYWFIEKTKLRIIGSTYMDNFDMADFLDTIGVSENVIEWS